MDDPFGMHVPDSFNQSLTGITGFLLGVGLLGYQPIVEVTTAHELHHHVAIILVLVGIIQRDNVGPVSE